jgi:hypothetical protein
LAVPQETFAHPEASLAGSYRLEVQTLTGKKKDEQVVRVAPLGELRAYTISEHEMEQLESGAPVSDLLTIGLCLLSAALTLLATLLSTSLTAVTLPLFFSAFLITSIIGGICTHLGWRGRVRTGELAKRIRARMPSAPGIQQIVVEQVESRALLEVTTAAPQKHPPVDPPKESKETSPPA